MELPNPIEVRDKFFEIEEKIDLFVNFLSKQNSLGFKDFIDKKNSINNKIIELFGQISLLIVQDKKYSKVFEGLNKILVRLLVDFGKIEKKYQFESVDILFWENKYKEGKLPVGGEVVPVNKLALLAPWIVIAIAVITIGFTISKKNYTCTKHIFFPTFYFFRLFLFYSLFAFLRIIYQVSRISHKKTELLNLFKVNYKLKLNS